MINHNKKVLLLRIMIKIKKFKKWIQIKKQTFNLIKINVILIMLMLQKKKTSMNMILNEKNILY